MKYRTLSADGDYTFGNGNLDFYIDIPEAVAQAVKTSLLLWLGEWYLDVTAGVPYMQSVIGKHSQDLADSTLVAQISQVQGVVNIVDFQSIIDPNTRTYSVVKGTINTIYGLTEVEIKNETNF